MTFAFLPKAITRRVGGNANESWHLNVVLSHSILLVLLFFSPALESTGHLARVCLVSCLVDIPCPGCGVTTSVVAVSKGEFTRALETNPAGVCVVAGIAAQAVFHMTALYWPRQDRRATLLSKGLGWSVLSSIFCVWFSRLAVCFS